MIPWNQHHILHIPQHSSVWYLVIQYNSSHMLLVSFPLIPFHNCHIDLDWQGQYLISAISVGNSPQMWHPNHGVDLSAFTRRSSLQQHQMTPDPFFRCETNRFFVSQTLPWHSHRSSHDAVWGAPAVGCEQEPKRREKIERERGRERVRGCLKEGFLPLWSNEGWEKGKNVKRQDNFEVLLQQSKCAKHSWLIDPISVPLFSWHISYHCYLRSKP